jgi:hypothetical protein
MELEVKVRYILVSLSFNIEQIFESQSKKGT